ncbi:MAG: hypothetical protein Tsb0020_55910 [Haliangiales bacterium]
MTFPTDPLTKVDVSAADSITEPDVAPDGPEDDVRLAADCASGDRAAQLRLFRTYRARVHATLYRVLGSNNEIEDLIQEAFLQVYRSLHSYRGDARLATWMSRITTRVAYAHISRRGPASVTLDAVAEPASVSADVAQQATAREALRRLYDLLEGVEAKHRIAFALHVIDGRPIREVAEMMEASPTATKMRIWRARKEIVKKAANDPWLVRFVTSKSTDRSSQKSTTRSSQKSTDRSSQKSTTRSTQKEAGR